MSATTDPIDVAARDLAVGDVVALDSGEFATVAHTHRQTNYKHPGFTVEVTFTDPDDPAPCPHVTYASDDTVRVVRHQS